MSAKDGQAAITRPHQVGWATATFAARRAALPVMSSAHGRMPPRFPQRESSSNVMDEATIIPSTDSGMSAAVHGDSPTARARACMCR
jgi:hypothetical protein